MSVVWAGLWSRRGIAAATLLLAVMAIAFAMIGPMYAHAAGEHLLDARIGELEPTSTMLTAARPAMPESDVPDGSPDRYQPPAPQDLLQKATSSMSGTGIGAYWNAAREWLLDEGGTLSAAGKHAILPLYWHQGMCDLTRVSGSCPTQAGQALIDTALAKTLHLSIGDRLHLAFDEQWLADGVNKSRQTTRSFTIVGTYAAPSTNDPRWGDPYRVLGNPSLRSTSGESGSNPRAPALLVAPASMTSQTFTGGADRTIDLDAVNLDTMHAAAAIGNKAALNFAHAEGSNAAPTFDLSSAVDDADSEFSTLSRITVAAVAPLVVLGLLLLYGLVAAGADVRRQNVALAKLRGLSRRGVLAFALAEPVAVIVIAIPIAVAAAWALTRLIANSWLGSQTPVGFGASAVVAGVIVVLAALVAAFIAVSRVQREPLSTTLGASGRAGRASRWALVGRSAVIALAVAVTLQVAVASSNQGGVLDLVAPILIALALAIAAGWVLLQITRIWIQRTATRGGTPSYLAARRLGRRRDLGTMVIPLVLATAVAAFAASAWVVGDDWKESRAAAEVGAARSYVASASPQRLLAVTHRVDPGGRYLAAVVLQTRGDDTDRQVLVDTSRLDTAASWDPSWSDTNIADLQRKLTPRGSIDPITFKGGTIAIGVTNAHLDNGIGDPPELAVDYLDDSGDASTAFLGRIRNGTLTAPLEHCSRQCTLQEVKVTGSGGSTTTAQGAFTITGVTIDHAPADWHLDTAKDWRAARPYAATPADPPVTVSESGDGLKVSVYLSSLPADAQGNTPTTASGIAGITPTDIPDVLPALIASDTSATRMPPPQSGIGTTYGSDVIAANALNQSPTPLRVVAEVKALPGIGTEGILTDLGASLRQPPAPSVTLDTRLWAASDTPAQLLDEVRAAGVSLSGERRESAVLEALRTDAFSLGWRIFLLVGGLTLVLALVGVYAGAVSQRRWRAFETASLLTILIRRRTLSLASILEHATVVGLVALFGLGAAWVSLRVVLPTVDLGDTRAVDPSADYAIRWPVILIVGLLAFLLATVVTSFVSLRTIRTAKPADLPWEEQQI